MVAFECSAEYVCVCSVLFFLAHSLVCLVAAARIYAFCIFISPCYMVWVVPCVMCCIVHRIIRQMTRCASAFDLTQFSLRNLIFFSLHYFVSSRLCRCDSDCVECVCAVAFAFRSRNHTPNIRFRSCEISIHGIRIKYLSLWYFTVCMRVYTLQ